MESFPAQRVESRQQISTEPASEHTEATLLLLPSVENDPKSHHISWVPPPGFLWIEIAIFSNVFLSGFDGTISASTYAVIGSEFNAANTISWLTTSYLITSTAFQPLYGRMLGVWAGNGCGLVKLNASTHRPWRGGLMTMATIINSDMIPFKQRGMYQACQNVLHGFGSICGASIGGWIADTIGWRWCFLCQVPVSIFAFVVGYYVIDDMRTLEVVVEQSEEPEPVVKASLWKQIDLSGAILLVLGLSAQLAALSMGGNNYTWSDIRVIISLIISAVLLSLFVIIEIRTQAIPVMPMSMLKGQLAVSNLISNICVGMAAYSFLFMIPLFFQVVLQDSPTQAGLRLVVPSLATPVGGVIAGIVMSRIGKLSWLVRAGCFLMMLGNGLVASLQYTESARWKYLLYLIPANLGQGMAYPGILFTFLAAFDHSQQAVSTSMVYLFRSLGTVWGVAASSAIIQNVLSSQLPLALSGVPNKEQIIDEIRHSVTVLDTLPVEIQSIARHIYYKALVYSFQASTAVGAIAFISAFFARGGNLNRK
ncbi:putative transporter [Lachnellula willkommii]|uniref:Putative transporter n=1 Tax=Lachnellula willkommii TaxID=215461 RepID=A0A559MFI6_9HELO|nr:putative transporter [Lachnellula willkommii]